jgi:CubicO group peptidase (beta-lactamase class C family)
MKTGFATIPLLFMFVILLHSGSCKKNEILCDPVPKFNIDTFIANVEAGLTDVAGYQFAVNRDGKLVYSSEAGFSIYAADPGGPVPMTVNTRMNVASVSKFIGTIALLQVLEKYNISIEQPIHSYLPATWKTITHTDHYEANSPYLVRFKNLLRMETGLDFNGNIWSPGIMPDTREMLRALTKPAKPNRWGVYQNGNFTLIRVLIGELEFKLDETASNYDQLCTDKYFEYIKQNIFDKLNLSPPMSVASINNYFSGNFTRGHQWPFDVTFRDNNNNLGWAATSDPTTNGGSGGLVLSSIDLAKVLAFFKHDETGLIISKNQRELILQNELGLIESMTGSNGRYQSKGGTRGPENTNNRALRSRIIFYPDDIEVVLLINSNFTQMGSLLRDSYDNAFVNDCL